MADALVAEGLITRFQADQMLRGRWRNFILGGKYIILEPLGAGGMGTVYLCSHRIMRRPVAVKVLPAVQADDPGAVERFQREAQAVAQLRTPISLAPTMSTATENSTSSSWSTSTASACKNSSIGAAL